jgi:hypothetical protein
MSFTQSRDSYAKSHKQSSPKINGPDDHKHNIRNHLTKSLSKPKGITTKSTTTVEPAVKSVVVTNDETQPNKTLPDNHLLENHVNNKKVTREELELERTRELIERTGMDETYAIMYLSTSKWDVDRAINLFKISVADQNKFKEMKLTELQTDEMTRSLSDIEKSIQIIIPSTDGNQVLFEALLRIWTKKVVIIEGDGNCLFKAISMGLLKRNDAHLILRDSACKWMKDNLETYLDPQRTVTFSQSIILKKHHETIMDYIKNMEIEGEWGDMACIIALSRALNIKFSVIYIQRYKDHSTRQTIDWYAVNSQIVVPTPMEPMTHIFLSYDGRHYNLIVDTNCL